MSGGRSWTWAGGLATPASAVGTVFRCPPGYYGLSCEACSPGFERVPGGSYLGTCAGCNCNGHAGACDPVNGHCLVPAAPPTPLSEPSLSPR